MGTQMAVYTNLINELKEKKDYKATMKVLLTQMLKSVETNSGGRALDRAMAQKLDKETIAEIHKIALQERIKGDEFYSEECEFFNFIMGIHDEL